MKLYRLWRMLPVLAALALSTGAQASTVTFEGLLTGAQEVPVPNNSPALGAGIVTVNTVTETFDVSLNVLGITLPQLNDGLVAAPVGPVHLHNAPAGVNGGIVVPFAFGPLYSDIGNTPLGFALNATNLSAANITGGLDFASLLGELRAGNIYFNVHTDAFPGGEIRGQLAIAPVPLPATGLMLGSVVAFGAWRMRARRKAA